MQDDFFAEGFIPPNPLCAQDALKILQVFYRTFTRSQSGKLTRLPKVGTTALEFSKNMKTLNA